MAQYVVNLTVNDVKENPKKTNLHSCVNHEVEHVVLTGNLDECVLSDAIIFAPPLLYKSLACCCCIIVGEGDMPVEPGIIDDSIMFPFIA